MAKKKKSTKRTSTRRRKSRVSGVGMLPGIPLEQLGAIAGGAIVSQSLNGMAKNVKALQDNKKVLPLLKIGLGAFAIIKGENPLLRNMGTGMVADGSLHLLRVAAPNSFQNLTGEAVGYAGSTLIDLDTISGNGYVYSEGHQVGGLDDQDFSVGAV